MSLPSTLKVLKLERGLRWAVDHGGDGVSGGVSEARPLPVFSCEMESHISGFKSKVIGSVGLLRAKSKVGREKEKRRGRIGKGVQNVQIVGSDPSWFGSVCRFEGFQV